MKMSVAMRVISRKSPKKRMTRTGGKQTIPSKSELMKTKKSLMRMLERNANQSTQMKMNKLQMTKMAMTSSSTSTI